MNNIVVNTKNANKEKIETTLNENPFPGLRTFTTKESYLFFGREGQSEEVLLNLAKNKFVAVVGTSGSGKSSLLYCGVVPILHGGFITKAGANWNIIKTTPGEDPINNLAAAIININKQSNNPQTKTIEVKHKKALISNLIKSSSIGLIEAIKQLNRPKNENILLFIDQFEELFRFKRIKDDINSSNESLIFVKNLLEVINQNELPIYIVITMRSDFIGECSQFPELTELINNSHYLIPQMKRENYIEAITGPIAVGGGKISQRLLNQLLNDVGDNQDQLPILQHALMRTWSYWTANRINNEPIDIEHYRAIGGMEKALSEHANEAYDELTPKGKEICEQMFKALTEKGFDNRGVRRPSPIIEVSQITEASEKEIFEVVEKFKKSGRSFITVSTKNQINKDSIIDISHESLMRIWGRLKTWVEEEASAVQTYIRLSDAASLYQKGKTGLWRPPDLQLAINWRKKQKPNLAWAKRYDPAFERTMSYLEFSEREFLAEEENKINLQKKRLRKSRTFAIILGIAAIISLGFMLYSFILQNEAIKQEKEAIKQKAFAEEQKNRAEKEFQEAERQKKLAIESEKEALLQKEIAQEQEARAVKNEKEARLQGKLATQRSEEVKKQKELADLNAQAAINQKQIAEEASSRAENLRMLSIAQTMAVKSSQENKDPQLKLLLAYQAYLFNKNNNGEPHHNDIYNGLYSAVKHIKGDNYNAIKKHKDAVNAVVAHPKNKNIFFSCSSDGKIIKWTKTDTSFSPTTILESNTINKSLTISKNGQWLACGTTNGISYLHNLKKPQDKPVVIKNHQGAILSLCFGSNSNKLYSAGVDKKIYELDILNNEVKLLADCDERIKSIKIAPNGELLAGASENGKIILWEIQKKAAPFILYEEKENTFFSVAFNKNGSMIAVGDLEGEVMIWNTKNKKLISVLRGHEARVSQVVFSQNSEFIASASFDKTINIWKLSNLKQQPIVIKNKESWLWSIDFSKDSKYLLSAYNNGYIAWNHTKTEPMAEDFCQMINRNMNQEEWKTYVAEDIPLKKTCN